MAGPDPQTLRSVVTALTEEIDTIKRALDVGISGAEHAEIAEAVTIMRRVADTMAVLGSGDLRKRMVNQVELLERNSATGEPAHDVLLEVAGEIIAIEQQLAILASGTIATEEHSAEEELQIGLAQQTVLQEARNGLEQAKDAIIEYIASQWDVEQLKDVPQLLNEIRGGLTMVPLLRPAEILDACGRFISEQLLPATQAPEWSTLDTLADAIASIEYYLERISGDRDEEDELLLRVAEESIEALGYGLGASAAPTTTLLLMIKQMPSQYWKKLLTSKVSKWIFCRFQRNLSKRWYPVK